MGDAVTDKSIILVMNDKAPEEKREEWSSYFFCMAEGGLRNIGLKEINGGGLVAGIKEYAHVFSNYKKDFLMSSRYKDIKEDADENAKSLWLLGSCSSPCPRGSSFSWLDKQDIVPVVHKGLCGIPLIFNSGWFLIHDGLSGDERDSERILEELSDFKGKNSYLNHQHVIDVCQLIDGTFALMVFDIENPNLIFVVVVDSEEKSSGEHDEIGISMLDDGMGYLIHAGTTEHTNSTDYATMQAMDGAKDLGKLKNNYLYTINREQQSIKAKSLDNSLTFSK